MPTIFTIMCKLNILDFCCIEDYTRSIRVQNELSTPSLHLDVKLLQAVALPYWSYQLPFERLR